MAWIELHQAVFRHPKTLAVAEALGIDRFRVIGHLSALWCWALDARPDGGPLSDRDVRAGAEWTQRKNLTAALLDAGFLDRRDDGLWLHDWTDYAGRLIERRRQNADRMKTARAQHVSRTSAARAPATVPNRTEPDHTEPDRERSSLDLRARELVLRVENRLGTDLGIQTPPVGWVASHLNAGATEEEFTQAIGIARERGAPRTRYLDTILENLRADRAAGRTRKRDSRTALGPVIGAASFDNEAVMERHRQKVTALFADGEVTA